MSFTLSDRRTGEVVFEGERASRTLPCPVCGDLHRTQGWCLVDRTRGLAICPRVQSSKRIGDAGWLHGDGMPSVQALAYRPSVEQAVIDFAPRWQAARRVATEAHRQRLASALGLPLSTVDTVEVGIDGEAWVFAMHGSDGEVCGLKVRTFDGRKMCVKGSRLGVIVPRAFKPNKRDLMVTEGESDLMVAAAWGFNAIGRAGCQSSVQQIAAMAAGKCVVLVADSDAAGKEGAARLCEACLATATTCRIVTPPCKDLREWHKQGATSQDLSWRLRSLL